MIANMEKGNQAKIAKEQKRLRQNFTSISKSVLKSSWWQRLVPPIKHSINVNESLFFAKTAQSKGLPYL